jgi:hypothetical protein
LELSNQEGWDWRKISHTCKIRDMHKKTLDGIPEGNISLGRVGTDERIQLKWVLNKYCLRM